ncbi:MAG TPA: phosphatase PAP2-related protein [Thermoanaerobaculia bacterium]|nr:phosphatase PAP2-related protein [Thermoanaerobaculia bacterium]
MRPLRESVLAALLWRYGCHSAMLLLSLFAEGRPAPHLPDTLLTHIPRIGWVAAHNYLFWLVCYLPPALWLWRRDPRAFRHFLYLGGALSLLRGLTVGLTGLGPVDGPDVNVGLGGPALWAAWLTLLNPFSSLFGNAAHVYLTKDLFFSGHVSTTFLLWLYCRGRGWLGRAALLGHWITVAVVFLSHLHYSIDVLGAWAITYSLYVWAERRWPFAAAEGAGESTPG